MSSVKSLLEVISDRLDREDIDIISQYKNFYTPINYKELFVDYVHDLVRRRNPDKMIIKSSVHVVLQDAVSDESLFLYPVWKFIDNSPEIDAREDVEMALSLLESGECKHIYLLFPKTENFNKHISIKSQKLNAKNIDYTLKLIPYKMDQKSIHSCTGGCK